MVATATNPSRNPSNPPRTEEQAFGFTKQRYPDAVSVNDAVLPVCFEKKEARERCFFFLFLPSLPDDPDDPSSKRSHMGPSRLFPWFPRGRATPTTPLWIRQCGAAFGYDGMLYFGGSCGLIGLELYSSNINATSTIHCRFIDLPEDKANVMDLPEDDQVKFVDLPEEVYHFRTLYTWVPVKLELEEDLVCGCANPLDILRMDTVTMMVWVFGITLKTREANVGV
ncbi:hypothetical protein TB2_002349 [Malus domestica]